MNTRFLTSTTFWVWCIGTLVCTLFIFLWELGLIASLPSPPRPDPSQLEYVFTALIVVLLSLDVGLLAWRQKHGSCPVGARKATGVAGVLSVITLLCPACLLLPFALLGTSISLVFLSPFVPLLRVITLVLLAVVTGMLWPRKL